MINAIKTYAMANYNNDWDVIVETYTDSELEAEVEGMTFAEALTHLQTIVSAYKAKRDEIRAEIF